METEGLAVTTRIARKNGGKLPRGIHRRGNSLVVSFALADGTIERRSLGPVSASYAQEQVGIFKRQVREGTYEKRKPRVESPAETTCADLWEAYKKDCQQRGVRRMDRLQLAWSHLKPVFGRRPASGVKPREIADYISTRLTDEIANATCNRELAILKAAFRVGARLEMVERVPMFPRRLTEATPRQGFVEEPQYKVLLKNAGELWLKTFLALGFNYGWRKSEILNLRVCNIDLLEGWITLENSKNGEGRRVKITSEIRALLAACIIGKQLDGFVLTRQDGSRIAQPRKAWYALCVASGFGKLDVRGHYNGLQMHDLRRSGVRRMRRLGVSETVAMKISGHKTRSIFQRYDITDERDLENAAKLIEPAGPSVQQPETDTKTDTPGFARV